MIGQSFLSAKIVGDGATAIPVDQVCVPWWSFTKTALGTAALQLVARGVWVSESDRARVTAGLAKEVEAVNQ
jgi:hypothetical protein